MTLEVTFRPLPVWPHPPTKFPAWSPFRASYSNTLEILERELNMLDGRNVVIGIGLRERDIRVDGLPRADARATTHHGVELSFDSTYGRLVYATDAFETGMGEVGWQANLRAIALGLEALRKVDRYGISRRGEQYAGYRALPGLAMGGMTEQTARTIIREWAGKTEGDDRSLYRAALKRAHPDVGGTAEIFAAVREAGRILSVA